MFFTTKIELDPSQITVIKRNKNNNIVNKIIDVIAAKHRKNNYEQETFTALNILSQIQMGLLRCGVDNLIKLDINGFSYYFDENQKEKDLSLAIQSLEYNLDRLESERFEDITLVLEHLDKNFKYYISIEVMRKHRVGEYPIKIVINGFFHRFFVDFPDESYDLLTTINRYFISQEEYENLIKNLEMYFKASIKELEFNLSNFINIDGIKNSFHRKILRPKNIGDNSMGIVFDENSEPGFHGYPGARNHLLYTLYWSILCRDNKIFCTDFILTDQSGFDIFEFEKHGFYANETTILNPDIELSIEDFSHKLIYNGNIFSKSLSKIMINEKFELSEFEINKIKVYNSEVE